MHIYIYIYRDVCVDEYFFIYPHISAVYVKKNAPYIERPPYRICRGNGRQIQKGLMGFTWFT